MENKIEITKEHYENLLNIAARCCNLCESVKTRKNKIDDFTVYDLEKAIEALKKVGLAREL